MEKYIHGYSETEQNRLVSQGEVLAPFIFDRIDLSNVSQLLEVGSGVGAMTLEVLKRYSDLEITCLEIAATQIEKAKVNLEKAGFESQVNFIQGDARNTALLENQPFEAAFLCWVLEHIPNCEKVLSELNRILKPNATLWITEVFHNSFHLFPHCPNVEKYWQKCIDFQATINGDANVGHRLGNLLFDAGFQAIEVQPYPMFWDKRNRKNRADLLQYWHGLMFSALENMVEANYCEEALWKLAEKEMLDLMNNDEAIFYYSFIQAKATKI
jgi:predicted O-methyltransferase YrrM